MASRAVSNLVLKGKGRARPEQIIEVDDGGEPEASGSGSGGTRSGGTPRTRVGVRKVVALSLVDLSFVLGLVFGGCCR